MDYQRLYEELPKEPIKWTIGDIQLWLRFIGLSNLYPKFKQLSIDGSCITTLNEQDLKDELTIQSGIIIKKIMSWVNKGLKEYSSFVESRENANPQQQIKEVTMKPRFYEQVYAVDIKGTYKPSTNKTSSVASNPMKMLNQFEKEAEYEEESSIIDEEDENKKKEYELIIQQSDGPQTSFFSVKEEGLRQEGIAPIRYSFQTRIKFEDGLFFLRDIGSTTGTFIKIEDRKQIYHNMIIEMGCNQFQATLINGNLTLTIIEGPAHDTIIQIPKQSKVTIGRKPNNLLNFSDDQHLSNLHSTIYYIDTQYYIQDMGTTNGTWERLSLEGESSELFEIRDKSVFKIGTNQTYICKIKMALISQKTHPNACVICCDQDKDCVYMPCKHNAACIKCSKNLKECPICRVKIEDFVRIYKS